MRNTYTTNTYSSTEPATGFFDLLRAYIQPSRIKIKYIILFHREVPKMAIAYCFIGK